MNLICTIIDSIIGDLKDAGFDMGGNGNKKESKDQKILWKICFKTHHVMQIKDLRKKSFGTLSEKDSNEESVVDVEKPNNIILLDNN